MRYPFLLLALLCQSPILLASTPMQGCLEATNVCPALHSIKKQSNPGNLELASGERYAIIARNKFKDATHYQITIGDNNSRRWVSMDCGEYVAQCQLSTPTPVSSNKNERYLLAVSWQPAFCETHQRKPECRNQTDLRFDATHFSLHGLWPQPRNNAYCGVSDKNKTIDRRGSGSWHLLPKLALDEETSKELAMVMPGVESGLHKHEWIKHGTCYGSDADDYFDDSMKVLQALNRSPVRDLFSENIGKRLSVKEIQRSFNQHFGDGSGKKVGVRCDRKNNISELFINLRGDLDTDDLPALLKSASKGDSNCQNNTGKVDAAGFDNDKSWLSRWFSSLF